MGRQLIHGGETDRVNSPSILRAGHAKPDTAACLVVAFLATALLLGTAVAEPALLPFAGGAAERSGAASGETFGPPARSVKAAAPPGSHGELALRERASQVDAPPPDLFFAIAQSVLDIIVGLPSMIYQLTTNFNQMVGAFGSILSNPGAMLDGIIQGSIDTVDSFTPTSWKQQWAPCMPSGVLNLTVAFFLNPFVSHTDSRRLQLCAAFVVGTGIGMILGMVLTGGITMLSILRKAGKLSVLGKFGQKVAGAASAAQDAVKGGLDGPGVDEGPGQGAWVALRLKTRGERERGRPRRVQGKG